MDWGHIGGSIRISCSRQRTVVRQCHALLCVPLLHHAEAAELALLGVEVAVVVGIAGHKDVTADMVVGFNALNHMDREGQPGNPGGAITFVLQIELR